MKPSLWSIGLLALALPGLSPPARGQSMSPETLQIVDAPSAVTAPLAGAQEVIIVFTTNGVSVGHVNYGPTSGYGLSADEPAPGTGHAIVLEGLLAGATYHYQVTATMGAASVSSPDATFTVGPGLMLVDQPRLLLPPLGAPTSAILVFTTSTVGTATVNYGPTVSYGSAAKESAPGTGHAIELTGLTPGATYHYQVIVTASDGTMTTLGDAVFSLTPFVPGDLNGDGVVDQADAIIALKIALGLMEPTPTQLIAGDVAPYGHPDGMITAGDAIVILRLAFKLPLPGR